MRATPNLPDNSAQVNTSPLAALREFAEPFCESQVSPRTADLYRIAVRKFLNWYEQNGHGKQINGTTLKRFRAAWPERASRTLNLYTTVAKVFLKAAAAERIVSWETAMSVSQIRNLPNSTVRPGKWLDLKTAEKLLAAPDPATIVGIRDRAILGLLLGAGLRRAELAKLRYEHFRHADGCWWIWRMAGKGRRVRDIPIAGWTKALVDDWAAAAGLPNAGPVFCRVDRGDHPATAVPLRARAAYEVVRRYAATIGIQLSPHDLRRTFAMLALNGGSDMRQIQFSLGHGSMAITERYLTREQTTTGAPANCLGITLKPHTKRVVSIEAAAAPEAAAVIARRAGG